MKDINPQWAFSMAHQALERMKVENEEEICGRGYPLLGLPCIRPKDHNPFKDCFAVKGGMGVYMQQDGKDWVGNNQMNWPNDIVTSHGWTNPKTGLWDGAKPKDQVTEKELIEGPTGRAAAIAATKAKHAKK